MGDALFFFGKTFVVGRSWAPSCQEIATSFEEQVPRCFLWRAVSFRNNFLKLFCK